MCSRVVKRIRIVAEENQNEEPIVMCKICSQILKSLETLKSHKKAMHENEQFICTDCGASLESMKQLNSHKRKHKSFLCDKCNRSISQNNKQRHQKLCSKYQFSVCHDRSPTLECQWSYLAISGQAGCPVSSQVWPVHHHFVYK